MKDLVIGDVHFGVRSNSVDWCDSQCRFIDEQIIDTIKKIIPDRVIFLGDLCDNRARINTIIGMKLKDEIVKLSDAYASVNPSGKIIFTAGNHDFCSPLEEHNKYNAYRFLFDKFFLDSHRNIIIVDTEPYYDNGALFLPWYWTENNEHFDDILYRYKFGDKGDVKCIYCHTDLSVWPGPRITSLKYCPVYSGHIHYKYSDEISHLYNLGAACQFTFLDVNDDRYIYIIEDYVITGKITNMITPKFKKIYNEEIFSVDDETFRNSLTQICISKSNIDTARYREQLKYIKIRWVDEYIRIHSVDDDIADTAYVGSGGFNTNIVNYIENNIPSELQDKYEYIKKQLNQQ